MDKNKVYQDSYNRLYKQINVNNKEQRKKDEFMDKTREAFMNSSNKAAVTVICGTPEGHSRGNSPTGK